ncbi:tannase, putative [Cordyceps militaris CM01]|uniref:Carboxylic ester hydrolase n=1 Tax=Cordyceps militaris (strain CM01) TaxID=983644 RepID=G3JBB2_CORMM|nr:tannase, putative [Cordyceps militaris CM01]EGX95270.1 tannase, putative [Cordyceps militaris CM01]
MKFALSHALLLVLAAADCALGLTRTEKVLSDGVVEVTYANFTAADMERVGRRGGSPRDLAARTYGPPASYPESTRTEFKDARTCWNYWWYSASCVLQCKLGQHCIACLKPLSVPATYTGGGSIAITHGDLQKFAKDFAKGEYEFPVSVMTEGPATMDWYGPSDRRFWLKQWFAVTEASVRSCTGGKCGDWMAIKSWMPCSNKDCFKYTLNDGYAQSTLQDICNVKYVQAALPADNSFPGITINSSSVSTAITYNASIAESDWNRAATINYCNVTFAYSHNGIADDVVHVSYWVPAPCAFRNRYLSTGGGGFAVNSGPRRVPWNSVFLLANGTINWQSVYMFGYQAHHELALIGKQLAANLYNVSANKTVYSYYMGCSEGGREGWSQLQRFADQFDGAVIGAPAIRYGQQQVNHLTSNVIEQTLGYYPPTCELAAIVNLTIAACDGLDGQTDGVVARSDLCKLNFNVSSTVGKAYSCAATTPRVMGGISIGASSPAQNGTITAKGAEVAATILEGLYDSDGKFVYLSYQPGASFSDAATTFDNATGSWKLYINGLGGEWVARYLELRNTSSLTSLSNYTYDTLRDLMIEGQTRYGDSLQTTQPDLRGLRSAGAKVILVHGEQDDSIPAGSSVHYYESVRSVMYANMTYNASVAAMDDFYRLFLVPGGAHCGTNPLQPNGQWPQTTLETVIEWVESKAAPETLDTKGTINSICRWPLRPLWSGNATTPDCVYDQASIDTWMYDFDAYSTPLY